MLALSTAYFTLRDVDPSGDEIVRGTLDLGLSALELDYRVTAAQMKEIRPFLTRDELRVVSVHHPFPRRPELSPLDAHVDRARLSAVDEDERRAAVRIGTETLARAADVGAGAVVLHLGDVELGDEIDPRELSRFVRAGKRETGEYEDLRARVAARRRSRAPSHVDAVLRSLDRLAEEAVRRDVCLGLENRYHPEQIPDRDELTTIFRELAGAPLGYWHDTGHAASLVALGFLEQPTELAEAFQARLLGLHLHDAIGLDDHKAPGQGEVDFAALASLSAAETRLVLEVHPPAAPQAVREATGVLADAGFAVIGAAAHPGTRPHRDRAEAPEDRVQPPGPPRD
ncbi:MAG: TIM barrel protein [Deltaproteobacteria bacterium]|nr:TIM barrel protein [Deltaproteobacteria bacterium]